MPSGIERPEHTRIVWRQWRGRVPTPPWVFVLFGVPLSLVGAFGLALGLGASPSLFQGPRLLILAAGLYFLFAGLGVLLCALQPRMRRAKLSGASPYLADYPWSAEGIGEDLESPVERMVLGVIVLSAVLLPLHIMAWFLVPDQRTADRVLLFGFFGLFDLILLVYIQQLVGFGLHRLRFGQTRVLFSQFPFFLGQRVQVTLEGDRQLRNRRLLATLRCIEESLESTKYDPEARIVCREAYASESEFATDGTGRASIAFSVPADAPSTELNRTLPTYWELVVESDAPGFRYRRVFLMPVYGFGDSTGPRL